MLINVMLIRKKQKTCRVKSIETERKSWLLRFEVSIPHKQFQITKTKKVLYMCYNKTHKLISVDNISNKIKLTRFNNLTMSVSKRFSFSTRTLNKKPWRKRKGCFYSHFCNNLCTMVLLKGKKLSHVKINAKYLTKTFAFGDFWNIIHGKNFRKFKIREILAAPKKKKHQILLQLKTIKVEIFHYFWKFPRFYDFFWFYEFRKNFRV